MQRQILFKAIALDSKEWIKGDLIHDSSGKAFIVKHPVMAQRWLPDKFTRITAMVEEVIPETVGQYSGYDTMDDYEIFEGDVIGDPTDVMDQGEVYFDEGSFYFVTVHHTELLSDYLNSKQRKVTIIHNIHDHHTTSKQSI